MSWADIRMSVRLEKVLNLPENSSTWGTLVSEFFSDPEILSPVLTISDRGILSLLDVFTLPLELILTVNWTSKLDTLMSELDVIVGYLNHYINFKCSISSPADLVILRWTYKHVREIARRMKFYRGEVPVEHPTFSESSQAATYATTTPVEISAPKIDYSKEDDEAIDEFHRRTGLSCKI